MTDTVQLSEEEYIEHLEKECSRWIRNFWIFQVVSTLFIIPMFLWLFFGFPIEYFGYSFIGAVFCCYLNGIFVALRDDAKDRLKRWQKIYGIIEEDEEEEYEDSEWVC